MHSPSNTITTEIKFQHMNFAAAAAKSLQLAPTQVLVKPLLMFYTSQIYPRSPWPCTLLTWYQRNDLSPDAFLW